MALILFARARLVTGRSPGGQPAQAPPRLRGSGLVLLKSQKERLSANRPTKPKLVPKKRRKPTLVSLQTRRIEQ
jgi:hypothetical protein